MTLRRLDKHETREEATVRLMSSDKDWPRMLLPLKNTQLPTKWGLGYMLNPIRDGRVRIYMGNIYNARPDDRYTDFTSIEAAVAAGWTVD